MRRVEMGSQGNGKEYRRARTEEGGEEIDEGQRK